MAKAGRKRGKPPRGEYVGKSDVLSFRITPTTKAALIQAAEASGRSLSQEAEHQLRRGVLDQGTGPTFALMTTIGKAIDSLVNLKSPKARWTEDAYLFDQARKAILGALEVLRPDGVPPETTEEALPLGGKMQGRLAMLELLRELQTVDTTIPFEKQTSHQRALTMLRADLDNLLERALIHGKTAQQARREHELGLQFGPLMQKAEKRRDAMTAQEWRTLWDLAGQLADLREGKS
jgi:hypothetical protein